MGWRILACGYPEASQPIEPMKIQPAPAGRLRLAICALSLGLTPVAFAAIDGTDDGTESYVTEAVQTHAPAWGAGNHLSNLRAVQDGNNLNVLLGGKADGNALVLFIDSKVGGINSIANNTITSGGEEGTINNLNGFTFETGFEADFAVRIFGNASGAYINTYNLATGVREYAGDAQFANISNTFIADARAIWTDLAAAAADHANGVELALDLGVLGVPTGTQDVKLVAMLINGDSNYASNQMLASQDGAAELGGGIVGFNLETEPGTQTITVSVTAANPDNDGDGLLNTVETNTGTYANPSNTGTDPDNPDTDGDLLSDGDEVNVHNTDPTKPDTDDDGANDATELSLGSDPQNGPAPDGGAVEIIGFDHFDYLDGGFNGATGYETRVFDFDNNTDNDAFLGHTGAVAPWTTSFGSQILCGRLLTDGSSATRAFNGPATGGSTLGRVENIAELDAKVVYARIDLTRLPGATFSGLSFLNGTTEVAFAGVRDALNGTDRNFGVEVSGEEGAAFSGDVPADRVPATIVARLDTTGIPTIALWVDPDLSTATAPAPDASAEFVTAANAVATGIRLASGGRTYWDELVVSTTWDALDAAEPTDGDGDDLRDSWEELYSPGDLVALTAAGNGDGDDLDNLAEQAAGTDPLSPDTDGDTLPDHVETNTGTFVDSDDTGTDPCDADTDDDNLADAVETGGGTFISATNTGTDPNLANSDGDLENDGFEVFQGTDPNNTASNSTDLGLVQVNGVRDPGDNYGAPLVVQTVQTQFGDNQSELNAAYARVQDGKLYLMLTGNLQDNFNKLEIFIDSTDVIPDNEFLSAGNDGADAMDGMLFDPEFRPQYHLIVRRGSGRFDLDFADLDNLDFDFYEDILTSGTFGYGSTGTGTNASPIRVAYNGSNTAGVLGGTAAADQAAAAAVTTGLEICIDLADLGSPATELKIMAAVNNDNHTFLSNQILGGLPADTENLGDPTAVDFSAIEGDQFFTVSLLEPVAPPSITAVSLVNGGTQLEIVVEGLIDGAAYVLTESGDLSGFGAVTTTVAPGANFTAAGTTQTLTVDLPTGTSRFYRIEDAP